MITSGKASETAQVKAQTSDGNYFAICNVRFYNAAQINARLNMLNYRDESGNQLPTHDEVTAPSAYALKRYQARIGVTQSGNPTVETLCSLFASNAPENIQGVTSVVITPSVADVTHHYERTLSVQVLPGDAVNKNITWKSSNTSIATVGQDGTVKGVSTGTVTITATAASGVSATCKLTVKPLLSTSIVLNPAEGFNLAIGMSRTITATIVPSIATNTTVKWASSDTSVATVTSGGVVKGIGIGTATITATAADGASKAQSYEITVGNKITGLSLSSTSISIAESKTATLTPKITPTNAIIQTLTWTSSNTSVATVNSNGVITAKAAGTAVITAKTTDGTNKSATCTVTVYKIAATDVKISRISPSVTKNQTVLVGETKSCPFKATVTPSNATDPVKWKLYSSSDSAYLSINENTGAITGKAYGRVRVKATAGSQSSGTEYVYIVPTTNGVSLANAKHENAQKAISFNGTSLSGTADRFVDIASSQVGYQNGTLSNDGSTVYFYKNSTGGWTKYGYETPNNKNGEYNWCAAFVSWCARKAGIPTSRIEKNADADMNINYNFKANDGSYTPSKGDLIYFGSSKSNVTHVGIVESYNSSTKRITTIEGNTWDGASLYGIVYKKYYDITVTNNNIIGFSDVF